MHPPRGSRAAYAGCSSGEEIDREIGLDLIEAAGSTRGKPRAGPLKRSRKSRRQRAPPATSSTGIPYHLLLVVGVLTFVGAAALISFNQTRFSGWPFWSSSGGGSAQPHIVMASTSPVSKGSSRPTDDRTQLNELQAAGFSIPDLRAEGFTDAQLLAAGYSAIDLISPPLSANPPPHLPPEPLAIGATELVTELNARYTLGKPSSAVADAGVLVHQVDAMDDGREGIDGGDKPWLPCPMYDTSGVRSWCHPFSDRFSASLVNSKLPFTFSLSRPGFVLHPNLVSIRCSYPTDGGSMKRLCEPPGQSANCSPGCWGEHEQEFKCARSNVPCYTDLKDMLHLHEKHHPFDSNDECKQGNGCMHNEIILDADIWVRHLPGIVQAFFIPSTASHGDDQRARKIHANFIAAFQLWSKPPPLLRLTTSNPTAPFQEISGALSAEKCVAITGEVDGKFWRMWGSQPWQMRLGGASACWASHDTGSKAFFSETRAGSRCDTNWYEGVGGELGRQSSRPAFTQAAPALLGLDDTLFEYCSELLGIQASYDGPEGGFNSKLAHRCVQANHNILRLTSARVPWSMCQTLQWLMCAARGQLPGQQSPTLHFAIAPKMLDIAEWYRPTTWPCSQASCPDAKYSMGDILFAEVFILHQARNEQDNQKTKLQTKHILTSYPNYQNILICSNGDKLFGIDQGKAFHCELNSDAFDVLATQLQQSLLEHPPPPPLVTPL